MLFAPSQKNKSPHSLKYIHQIHKGSVTSNDSGLGFFNDHHHTYYTTTGSGSLSSHPPAQSQGASGQHSQLQQPSASLQNAELALRQGALNYLDYRLECIH